MPEWKPEDFAGLEYEINGKPYPAVNAFVETLRTLHVNGGACFGSFRFPKSTAFREVAGRGALVEAGFFDHFWRTDAVRTALPELAAQRGFACRYPFIYANPFTLDGEFASALYLGGAYALYLGTTSDAKAEGAAPAAELLGRRFEKVQVYTNDRDWCDYFEEVIACTRVIVNCRSKLLHVIVATDVD